MTLGKSAVDFARICVDAEVRGRMADIPDPALSSEMRGVFVTLNKYPSGDLRGCIGFPYPIMPLTDAIRGSAESACHDPRFPDLGEDELDLITVEVTLLSVPEELMFDDPRDLPGMIVIGRDGLIMECMGHRGLLLPQVPVEWGWDATEYLRYLSMKAGLPSDAWMHPDTRIWAFEGEVFSEDSPRGNVSERKI